jgi:broad specificity phosphatase PhoE
MLLLLVRHGLTDWNESGRLLGRTDIGLNARGRAQAAAVAQALAEAGADRLLSSPRRRTQETAAAIGEAAGLAIQTEAALDEVWLAPRWQGRTFAELADDPDIRRYLADPTHRCDAMEPAAAVRDRVVHLVDRLQGEREGQTAMLVSHGDPLRLLVSHHLGMALGDFRRLTVSPGSVTVLGTSARSSRLFLLNWKPGPVTLKEVMAGIM